MPANFGDRLTGESQDKQQNDARKESRECEYNAVSDYLI